MRFHYRLAEPADDPALRALLRELPVEGPIRLRFEREPDYFAAAQPGDQTLVACTAEGRLAALATRGLRPAFINGQIQPLGYLGQLRVHPDFQGHWLLGGGFRFLRELHADGRCSGYLTTITQANRLAEGVLVRSARPGFPRYHRLAGVHTFVYPIRRGTVRTRSGPVPAELYAEPPQFLPCQLPDLEFQRLDQAAAALWVPAGRQVVVAGYQSWLALARPLGRLLGLALPPAGTALRLGYAAYLRATPASFLPLLDSLLELARRQGLEYLALGLCEGDPNLAPASRRPHQEYLSTLYWVGWEPPPALDGRPLFLEVGLL